MEPAEKIEPTVWMQSAAVGALFRALDTGEHPARFVGGCVRDMLLDRDVKDVDVATPLMPAEVMARLDDIGVRTIATGIDHGTVTAIVDDPDCPFRHFEITTLRADVTTDGRRATVAFIDDWAADAARRDFTINALFCDVDGTVYDPVDGLADLGAHRVRFVGDPAQRIREDVLRLLRFFRFQAVYGRGSADAAGLAACTELAPMLPTLSGERVAHELMRLLSADDPAPVLSLMSGQGILGHLLPEVGAIDRMAALVDLECATVGADPLRRLAAMLVVDVEGSVAVAGRLRLSKAQRLRLVGLAGSRSGVDDTATLQQGHAWLYELGDVGFVDLVLFAWADQVAHGIAQMGTREAAWRELLDLPQHWSPPALPIRGDDVKALGIAPGPAIGQALKAVETWWIDGDFKSDRNACLARLTEIAGIEG